MGIGLGLLGEPEGRLMTTLPLWLMMSTYTSGDTCRDRSEADRAVLFSVANAT